MDYQIHAEKSYIVKKAITYISISLSTLFGQFDLYPVTDFFGGGIGYSPMYISIDEFPATDLLKNLGLDPTKFNTPFVVHGGEGFAHMTGKWRIGGYAGIGSSSISEGADVQLYVDTGVEGFDGEDVVAYDDNFAPNIEAKITLSLGAACLLYTSPSPRD